MVVNTPVDSTTYCAPAAAQFIALGSLSVNTLILHPATIHIMSTRAVYKSNSTRKGLIHRDPTFISYLNDVENLRVTRTRKNTTNFCSKYLLNEISTNNLCCARGTLLISRSRNGIAVGFERKKSPVQVPLGGTGICFVFCHSSNSKILTSIPFENLRLILIESFQIKSNSIVTILN